MPVGTLEERTEGKVKIDGKEYEITEGAKKFAERIKIGEKVFYREKNGKVFFIKKAFRRRVPKFPV